MSFYPPNVLPRVELKYKAKELLRGNWPIVLAVTILFVLLTGFQVSFNYGETDEGAMFANVQDATTPQIVAAYFSYTLSNLGSAIANIGVGQTVLLVFLAVALSLLIDGVLSFCYNAWFVKLAELGGSRPLTFNDFAESFNFGVKAALAYIWQQLWTLIWSLLGLPGFLLLVYGAFAVATDSPETMMASISTGSTSTMIVLGSFLYLGGMIAIYIITLRYVFVFQLVADGRGKVGARNALRYSCAITKGHLKELFVLELSFIPWYLAGVFTMGLAFFYLVPYMTATRAMAYRWLRDEAFNDGRLDPAALGYVQAGKKQAATGTVIDI
ncbi:MAG: DUF975 family protein [Peptococcaceae bacterium]|nr:DUF975 family protein [Peptococcaceae bacterium]